MLPDTRKARGNTQRLLIWYNCIMDRLLIKANGQWELFKSKKVSYGGVYHAVRHNQQYEFLDDDQQFKAQQHMLEHYKQNKLPIEQRVNHATGKAEPHLLMERGVHNESTWEPNASGPNMMDWSTDPNYITTSHHTVMATSDYHVPNDKRAPGYTTEGSKGVSLKFWVPISHIVGGRRYLAENHMSADNPHLKDEMFFDDNHVVLKPGKFPLYSKQHVRAKPNSGDNIVNQPQLINKK